jgi:uncharacterized protein (DUF433 family)
VRNSSCFTKLNAVLDSVGDNTLVVHPLGFTFAYPTGSTTAIAPCTNRPARPVVFDHGRRGCICCRAAELRSGLLSAMLRTMSSPLDRITIDPEQCGGRACIRGMRIRVIDVLDLLAAGLDSGQILKELPDLVAEDIKAALLYARRRLDHPTLAA